MIFINLLVVHCLAHSWWWNKVNAGRINVILIVKTIQIKCYLKNDFFMSSPLSFQCLQHFAGPRLSTCSLGWNLMGSSRVSWASTLWRGSPTWTVLMAQWSTTGMELCTLPCSFPALSSSACSMYFFFFFCQCILLHAVFLSVTVLIMSCNNSYHAV